MILAGALSDMRTPPTGFLTDGAIANLVDIALLLLVLLLLFTTVLVVKRLFEETFGDD
ncbi:MAG: hypothetical protein ACREMY_00105 [bacterium]